MSVREIALGLLMQADDEGGSSKNIVAKSITANGTYNAADDNADGYDPVTVNVQPKLTEKYISANGTYKAADDSADGYSVVYVNVPQDWTDAKKLLDPPKDEDGNIIPSESEDGKVTVSGGGVIPVDPKNDPDTISGITAGIGSLDDTPIYYTDTDGKHYSIKFYTVFHEKYSFPFQNNDATSFNYDVINLETGEVTSKGQSWVDPIGIPGSIGTRILSVKPIDVGNGKTSFEVAIAGHDTNGNWYTCTKKLGPYTLDANNETWISTSRPTYTEA